MRLRAFPHAMLFVCCLLFSMTPSRTAMADGGRLIGVERIDGFVISIFVAPDPPRVGVIDLSVLIQRESDSAIVEDADVAVSMALSTEFTGSVSGPATREQATNKLLRSAWLTIPTAGQWRGVVHITVAANKVEARFVVEVVEAPPAWRTIAPWVLWPFAIVFLFGAHRFLLQRNTKAVPKPACNSAEGADSGAPDSHSL